MFVSHDEPMTKDPPYQTPPVSAEKRRFQQVLFIDIPFPIHRKKGKLPRNRRGKPSTLFVHFFKKKPNCPSKTARQYQKSRSSHQGRKSVQKQSRNQLIMRYNQLIYTLLCCNNPRREKKIFSNRRKISIFAKRLCILIVFITN